MEFNNNKNNLKYYSMKLFLESDFINYHPLNFIFMNEFFFCFHSFCFLKELDAKKQNYGPIWKCYNIKVGYKNKRKVLFGIDIQESIKKELLKIKIN